MINARPYRESFTTSIVVPCHSKHARSLNELIDNLEQSSVLPDEVVISLSGVKNIAEGVVGNIKKSNKFKISIIVANEELSEPNNRNLACSNATSDILICQDADDLSHYRRIEIIKHFFENYDIQHLMHGMSEDEITPDLLPMTALGKIRFERIRYLNFKNINDIFDHGIVIGFGPSSFLKSVFDQHKYIEKELGHADMGHAIKIYNSLETKNKNMVLLCDIYLYRWAMSSYHTK